MANEEHLNRLVQVAWRRTRGFQDINDIKDVESWNQWRKANPEIKPNLSRGFLLKAELPGVNLSRSNLVGADLSQADLSRANLSRVDLSRANLSGAKLIGANLSGAKFFRAKLPMAHLKGSVLVETNFERANLTGCFVYGISAWNVNLIGAQQLDLVITDANEPEITVDHLAVAQFIYLLLDNERIREVINTIIRSPPKRC
jgi:hypothetical protein